MSKSAWIHIIFDNACSTLGLWLEKIGGSEFFLILIPYLGPLVHSAPGPGKLGDRGTLFLQTIISVRFLQLWQI